MPTTQPSLFGADDPPAPPKAGLRCEPWLARKVAQVTAGVYTVEAALTWDAKRAYAVVASYEKRTAKRAEAEAGGESDPAPQTRPRPEPPPFMRLQILAELAGVVAEYERGAATEDDLEGALRAGLYLLTGTELLRVSKGIAKLLGDQTNG